MIPKYIFDEDVKDAHLTKVNQSTDIMEKLDIWIKKPQNIFLFHGNVGTGKSYFCQAWYNHMYEKGIHVRCITDEEFFSDLKKEMGEKRIPDYRVKTICESNFLIFDDFASSRKKLEDKDWSIDMLSLVISLRYQNKLPTMITSNKTKSEFRSIFDPRICSRLFSSGNMIIENCGHDRRNPQF